MKPDWDKLMTEFKDDPARLIADVDCTAAGKELCSDLGVRGYPTIKYGDPNNLEDYQGGRTYGDLKTFILENIGPSCGPGNLELCDVEKRKLVDQFMALSDEDLAASIKEKSGEIDTAEATAKELGKTLQEQFNEGTKAKDAKKKAIKEGGLNLMKAVFAHKKANNEL